jgi:serine/threonine protein kinase
MASAASYRVAPVDSFADHVLVRRLDSGGSIEFHQAHPSSAPNDPRLLVRLGAGSIRWPPWADPGLARVLTHPNVVRMFNSAAFAEPPYFSFEFVQGLSLRELLVSTPMSPRASCFVAREIAAGLAYALESKAQDGTPLRWTHGQLCPRAIQISVSGQVKVSGFGVGRLKPETVGEPIKALGNERLQFLAPEQVASPKDSVDPSTDVFAVGAVLHDMLNPGPLIDVSGPLEYLRGLTRDDVTTFSRVRDGVSHELSALLSEMLARHPSSRPADASELRRRLERLPELGESAAAPAELTASVRHAIQRTVPDQS